MGAARFLPHEAAAVGVSSVTVPPAFTRVCRSRPLGCSPGPPPASPPTQGNLGPRNSLGSEGKTGGCREVSRLGLLSPRAGGAPTEDLRALSRQRVNMDMATFKTLQTEAVLVGLGAGPSWGGGGAGGRGAGPGRGCRSAAQGSVPNSGGP